MRRDHLRAETHAGAERYVQARTVLEAEGETVIGARKHRGHPRQRIVGAVTHAIVGLRHLVAYRPCRGQRG